MINNENELAHVGVMGMRWGHKKASGWSPSTSTAKQHVAKVGKKLAGPTKKLKPTPYAKPKNAPPKRLTDAQLRSKINRIEMEKKYALLTKKQMSPGQKIVMDILGKAAKDQATAFVSKHLGKGMDKFMPKDIPTTS